MRLRMTSRSQIRPSMRDAIADNDSREDRSARYREMLPPSKIAVSAGAGDLQLTVKHAFVSAVRPQCP